MLDYEVTTYTTTTVVTTTTQTINSTETQTVTVITTNTVVGTTTQSVNATGTTKLSELGVSAGGVEIYSYENGTQSISTITPDETIADLVAKIPGATFSDGRLILDGVKIVNDGTTSNLVSALGLTETTKGSAKVGKSEALFYKTLGADAASAPSDPNVGFMEQIVRRDTSEMTAFSVVSASTSISSGTYSISTTDDFLKFTNMVNNNKIKGGEFVLADNIDFSVYGTWSPMHDTGRFTLDGNGYAIYNLQISSDTGSPVGLFQTLYEATIKNLGFEDVSIETTSNVPVGVIAGQALGCNIENCYVSGSITANGAAAVGTVAGVFSGGEISNCSVNGTITATGTTAFVGGLVGCSAAQSAVFHNCNIYSKITADTNDAINLSNSGGAIGKASNSNVTLSNINVFSPSTSEIRARFVGLVQDGYDISITGSKYNSSFSSSLKDYIKEYRKINTGNTTSVAPVSSVTPEFVNFINPRSTTSLTPLLSVTGSLARGITCSISTPEELMQLASYVNTEGLKGWNIVLANDIDMTGYDWTPIGVDPSKPFVGNFDGNGYKITGLNIDDSLSAINMPAYGLFGFVESNSVIGNLAIEDANITVANSNAFAVGGIAGLLNESRIENCYFSGNINSSNIATGGIVGVALSNSRIIYSNAYGNITLSSVDANIGGVAGVANSNALIGGCNVYSQLKASSPRTVHSGGIVGLGNNIQISSSNVYCPSTSTLNSRFIGMVSSNDINMDNCYYSSDFNSLCDYMMEPVMPATDTTGTANFTPTYYLPLQECYVSAWDIPGSAKLVNLTDADGNSLGITTGTVTITNNGTAATCTITNQTTLSELLNNLGCTSESAPDSGAGVGRITISGIKSIDDGTSNAISKIFGTSHVTGLDFATNSSLLQTVTTTTGPSAGETTTTIMTTTVPITTIQTITVTTTNTTSSTATYAINGSTRLSDLSDEPLPTNWVLNMKDKNGQDVSRTINIRSTETFDSLMYKLNAIDGITAYLENGNKFTIVTDPDKYSSVYMDGAMSDYLGMSALYIGDSTGLQISSKELKYNETHTATSRLSASNYADESVKLSDLNISSGEFTLFNNGVHKIITVDENETLGQLKSRITTAFSDLRFEINDGKISIYSTNKTDVYAGSNIDSSNIASILNFERNEETHGLTSQSPKYMVSEDSVVTKSGLFRSGTVTTGKFKVGGEEITIDSNTTMSEIINQINYSDKAQARAYWDSVNGELVITSKVTGAFYIDIEAGDSNFTDILGFTEEDGGVKKLDTTSQTIGKNAIFSINGTRITSNSNTIKSDISRIEGLTINLKDVTEGETVTINIEKDKETPANAISDVVDAYNELIENVDKEVARGGNLSDQSALKLIRNQLRSLMTNTISTSSVYKNLAAIGIKTEAARGGNISTANIHKMYFDKDKFEDAFMGDSEGIKTLLVGTDDAKGVFMQLENVVENALSSVSGYFDSAANSYTKKIKRYDDKISKLDLAADRYKARLEKKFQAMDMVISKIQNSYASFLG